jgi:CheY-like chemotaxis protein
MPTSLPQTTIRRIAVVDDNEDARETMRDELTLEGLEAFALDGPFKTAQVLIDHVRSVADAAVCDHRLISNYAPITGAEVASRMYEQRVPAVVVTQWSNADIDEFRLHRRQIPLLLKATEVTADLILDGLNRCLREFSGDFLPTRKPYRCLVRVEDVDRSQNPAIVYAFVPGWSSREVIRFPISLVPSTLHSDVKAGERFFATVNKGAEDTADLYLVDFER